MIRGILSLGIGIVCILNFARVPFGLWEAFGLGIGLLNLFMAACLISEARQ